VTKKRGRRKEKRDTFRFIHKIALAIEEKSEIETKKGHKED